MSFNKKAFLSKTGEFITSLHEFSKTRRAKRIGIFVLILFILYSVGGFFILPPYVKRIAIEKLGGQLGRQVSIESISLNPYTLGVTVKGLEIKEGDGRTTFLSFGSLYINPKIISIMRGGPVIREVKLDKPYIHLVRTDANTYNFSEIVNKFQDKGRTGVLKKAEEPFRYSFSNIQIMDGNVVFEDQPDRTRHEITQINISIPFISNLPTYVEAFVQPALSALINGTPLNVKGATKIFADSRETSLDVALKDIDIPFYLAYVPANINVRVPSGKLDVVLKITYRQFSDRRPLLTLLGEIKVKDLRIGIKKDQGDFLKIPLFSIIDIAFDLNAGKISIGSITTERGWVAITKLKEGGMNLDSLITRAPSMPTAASKKSTPVPAQWAVLLKSLVVEDYTVHITDRSLLEPFHETVDSIKCKAVNISTDEKDEKGTIAVSMGVGRKGAASIDGDLKLNPVTANLAVNFKSISLKPMQAFIAERMRVIMAAGALNLNGNLTALDNGKEGLKTAFKGKLWVNKLSLLDKVNAEDLLKWDSLYIGDVDIRYMPLFVHIRDIALSNFYSRIIINADKTLNLQRVFNTTTTSAPEGALSSPTSLAAATSENESKIMRERNIRIDKITLQGGTINFTDESITPRFSSNLFEIGGRISGLTSGEDKAGEVELRGKYDRYAPLEITGKINPLRNDLFADLKVDFKDMDLTQVSPYGGRYAGYSIQKGKLSFQLQYLIAKNKLDAKNSIFIDQFTFGDAVESPDATKLPVKLAVALLKDRNGEIKLDIPVSGDLNDPKFSAGRIVLKILMNLLEKAATSPFALLGAVFGGGEQLGYAEFDSGSASLTDETKKKLDILGKALYDRPSLKLDIVGHADPEQDREGLKRNIMIRKVKVQKVKEMSKKSGETPSLDSIIVTSQEYPEYLKRAYKDEKFPKPRNIIGLAKDLPVPEMEKLMLTNTKVTEDDLRALANERAHAVMDYLLQSKQVGEERIFVVAAKTLSAEKKNGVKDSRTDFTLK